MKTFDTWSVVYHRIKFSEQEKRPCDCRDCKEFMAQRGLDINGNDLENR